MTNFYRQQFTSDPAPANQGTIAGNKFVVTTPTPTLVGSTLLVHATIANAVGNSITGVTDTINGAYTLADQLAGGASGESTGLWHFQNAAVVGAGDHGKATGGSASTCVDTTKTWTTNQWAGAKVINLSSGQPIGTVSANTATTLTLSGAGSFSANQLYAVGDWVTLTVSGNDDYNAATVSEVTGVLASSVLGHNAVQNSYTSGTDNILSGTAALGSGLVLIVGFSSNDFGATTGVAAPGTGNTDDGRLWVFDQPAGIARFQHRIVSAPGTAGSNFSAPTSDHWQTFMIGLALTAAGASKFFSNRGMDGGVQSMDGGIRADANIMSKKYFLPSRGFNRSSGGLLVPRS